MYIHNLSPVLFNIGFLEIRWYSLAYILGIFDWLVAWKKILKINRDNNLALNIDSFDNLISYIIISIIIGGRLDIFYFIT